MSPNASTKIFCALDTDRLDRAVEWATEIGPVIRGLKLGMEFFYRFGPGGVETIREACPEAELFIDLKLHDIPNTVANGIRTLSENLEPEYLNVHASGGHEMMAAAKDACKGKTKLLAVTILTSLDVEAAQKIGYQGSSTKDMVIRLAQNTKEAGLDGVVCSAHEIEILRNLCGKDFVLMVPGIRPKGSDTNDQKRVMSPDEALAKGATHLVIGRPITQAPNPAKAAQDILDSLAQ